MLWILFVMLLKSTVWFFAFRAGTRSSALGMLSFAVGCAVLLTLFDKVSVASNLAFSAILLTLALYALMSFILMPLAWKVKNSAFSVVCNLGGLMGAFAGVNFTMDFLRGLLPFMQS